MADQVGRILELKGEVTVTGAGCEHRTLKAGDVLQKGDVIHTAKGAELKLVLLGGAEYFLRELQTITLDDEATGAVISDQDTALFAGNGDINDILAAIESGESLDGLLEETAAGYGNGPEGPTSEGNSSTVTVEGNEETVNPVNYEFNSGRHDFAPSENRHSGRHEDEQFRGNRDSGNQGQTPAVATAAAPGSTLNAPEITTAPLLNHSLNQITGKGDAGTTITLTIDGKPAGQTTVGKDGNWTINLDKPLGEGDHTIVATATDAAGNTATVTETVHIDSTPPIAEFTTGTLLNHDLTQITGKGEPGSTIALTIDGKPAGQTTVGTDGTWTITLDKPLGEGDHTIVATATDAAGNTATVTETVLIDTTAPVPVFTTGTLLNHDLSQITGKGEPGSTIMLTIDGKPAGQTIVGADGNWTITLLKPLGEGDHSIVAVATDAAGNTATVTETVHIDTTPPAPPEFTTGTLLNHDLSQITGKGEAGSTITLLVDGREVGHGTVGSDGIWTVKLDTTLADGQYTIVAMAKDGAGNIASSTQSVLIDTIAPLAPEITTGALLNHDISQITGKGEPGSSVSLTIDGKPIDPVSVDASGNWTVSLGKPLGEGDHTIVATATDAVGNQSVAATFPIVIDAINDAPLVTDTTRYADEKVQSVTITKAELLATAYDINLGDTLSIKNVTLDTSQWQLDTKDWQVVVTRDGVTQTPVGVDQLQQNLTVPEGTTTVDLTFQGSLAGYHNPMGWFTVGADGNPQNLQIIWNDVKDLKTGTHVSLDVAPGQKLGLFMVANQATWFESHFDAAKMTMGLDMANNQLRVYDEHHTLIKTFGPDVTMSTLTTGNDTAWDVSSGLKGGQLYIGFDDQPGGDNDYNDIFVSLAFHTSPGSVVANQDGSWTITKPPGYQGDVVVHYTVTDGAADTQGTYTVAFRDSTPGVSTHLASDGQDVFKWNFAENSSAAPGHPLTDTVAQFNPNQDKLHLADLLQGEHHAGNDLGNLGQYLAVSSEISGSQTNTVIHISSHGQFDASHGNIANVEDQKIVLTNVDLVHNESDQSKVLQNLLKNLIVD